MVIKLPQQFEGETTYFALAKSNESLSELMEQKLNIVSIEDENVFFYPGRFKLVGMVNSDFDSYNEFDVFVVYPNNIGHRVYNSATVENVLFLAERCDSNCVMCPCTENSRKKGFIANLNEILEQIKYIPSDSPHLTITGGEPFLIGDGIFDILSALKDKFLRTDFLLLTNGRAFSRQNFVSKFCETMPKNMILGIPLHGSDERSHDLISQAKGSFMQTVYGIQELIKNDIRIEIRIVVSQLNINNINNIVDFIVANFPKVYRVKIIGLEMMGSAFVNHSKVWVPYKVAFEASKNGIIKLVKAGIDVGLYNFPLCAVEKGFWNICERSITEYKIRYDNSCEQCLVKDACGGIFASSLKFAKDDLSIIRGEA